MGMPFSMGIWQMHMEQQPTWIAPMDACATALMTGLAPTAPSHRSARLKPIAVAMVKPLTRTKPMGAHAHAPTIMKDLIVARCHPATRHCIVLQTASPTMRIALMVVFVSATQVSVGMTVPLKPLPSQTPHTLNVARLMILIWSPMKDGNQRYSLSMGRRSL